MRGIYIIVVSISRTVEISVGALGAILFKKGLYAYVGSGQRHLEKRVERHFRKDKRKFWHIDSLLENSAAKVVDAFWKKANKSMECEVAKELCGIGTPIVGFGCSDCSCASHLFMFDDSSNSSLNSFLALDFTHVLRS